MRGEWERLHAEMVVGVRSTHAVVVYREIVRRHAGLARFPEPMSLATHLEQLRDHGQANVLYLSLLDTWRARDPPAARVSAEIIWLALWPLLTVVFRRQRGFWTGQEDDLVSEIGASLGRVARVTDFARVESVALTLARNTERYLVATQRAALRTSLRLTEDLDEAPALIEDEPRPDSSVEAPEWLERILGVDTELVVAAYRSGCDYDFLVAHFGLGRDEIRRRLRRAYRRFKSEQRRGNVIEFP